MKLELGFYGAAREVTGSRHFLETGTTQLLMDCGLFQGHRKESIAKNRSFQPSPSSLSAVLLSHAHIDHSGALPLLAKSNYKNPIHCTGPTVDLCRIMLMDSAHLQEEDAKFFNKIHQSEGETIEPLYTKADVEKILGLFQAHEYEEFFPVGDGVRACFLNAGHVLGSAMILVEVETPKGRRRVLFTGDLGRQKTVLMEPPVIPKNIDYLLTESTYGGRFHEPLEEAGDVLASVIQRAFQERGIVLIPSFALERTQEIVFILDRLIEKKKIPPIHLYVDSPMATSVTELFTRHLASASLSDEFRRYVTQHGNPFESGLVRFVKSVDESKKMNDLSGTRVILSASGMCEGGRILHHLRNNIGKDNTTILLVGYQAEGTLGRRLIDGAPRVKIFGLMHEVRARVQLLPHFSSHADHNDLVNFVTSLTPRPRGVFLVHGDDAATATLRASLEQKGLEQIFIAEYGQKFELH